MNKGKDQYVYKIRDNETGKFANGKSSAHFDDEGRIFLEHNAKTLKTFISRALNNYWRKTTFSNCEIVKFKLTEVECTPEEKNWLRHRKLKKKIKQL